MKQWLCCTMLLCSAAWARDEISPTFTVGEYRELIESVVVRQPQNKEVMFINMLFQLPANVRTNEMHLANMARILRRTSDRRFRKDYDENTNYKSWMIELIQEIRTCNASKEEDIHNLAKNMLNAGHKMGDAVNSLNGYKLLFLIRHLSSGNHRVLLTNAADKEITSTQLMVVLQEEQNSRTNEVTGEGE